MFNAGLILEGGGMRGVYVAGVLDFLLENEIFFANNYGVSAGVCHACSYLSRQHGRAAKTVLDYAGDPRYASFRSFIKTGDFFGVKMVYDDVPNIYLPFDYSSFAAKPERLTAVLTDCETGKAVYKDVDELRHGIDIIRASSSLPLLSRMVRLDDGRDYLDGGIADSVPLAHSISEGNRKNLVILTQHRGYQKSKNSMMPLVRAKYRKYPALVQAIETRHLRYNEALALIEDEDREGHAFVIQPKAPVEIGRLEKDAAKLEALYRQGCEDTAEVIGEIKSFFEA